MGSESETRPANVRRTLVRIWLITIGYILILFLAMKLAGANFSGLTLRDIEQTIRWWLPIAVIYVCAHTAVMYFLLIWNRTHSKSAEDKQISN